MPVPLHCPPHVVLSYLCSSVSYCPGLGHDLSLWAAEALDPRLEPSFHPASDSELGAKMGTSWKIKLTQQAEESISNKHRLQ